MTPITPHRHIKKRLIKTVGAHTPCSCGYIQGGELYFYIKGYQGNVYKRDGSSFVFVAKVHPTHCSVKGTKNRPIYETVLSQIIVHVKFLSVLLPVMGLSLQ